MKDIGIHMNDERIAILDFGSTHTLALTRRLRELGAFGLVYKPDASMEEISGRDLRGIILSGGPNSILGLNAPKLNPALLALGVPILGICCGMHALAISGKASIRPSEKQEYVKAAIDVTDSDSELFTGITGAQDVWMCHGERIESCPDGFAVVAESENGTIAAIENRRMKHFGILFHPEVAHTQHGNGLLMNFLRLCGINLGWDVRRFIQEKIEVINAQVGSSGTVLLGLSGGIDSSVSALLLQKAIGNRLSCVFVDTGLMRKDEMRIVQSVFAPFNLSVKWVDESDRFLGELDGVNDPEEKRKTIGRVFIEIFEREAKATGATFLCQGTIYPDVLESMRVDGADPVKSHHNVGGLPEQMNMELVEPLRELFKDEVRRVGLALGLPEAMVFRHPFPGPGLAVRLPGPITRDRIRLAQEADAVFIDELIKSDWYQKTSQAFAVLLPVKAVGITDEKRTYENICVLRAIRSEDFMTADWVYLPHDLLDRCARRIIGEVKGVNRVVFDITSKPPASVEYE